MLWNGIEVVDNSRSRQSKHFKLRAILMWTMHEYPRYGDLASLSTSGYYACPPCGMSLTSRHSADLRKVVYEGHRGSILMRDVQSVHAMFEKQSHTYGRQKIGLSIGRRGIGQGQRLQA